MGTFPVVIKEALNMLGFNVGDCAAPILPLDEEQRAKLRGVLREIGLPSRRTGPSSATA